MHASSALLARNSIQVRRSPTPSRIHTCLLTHVEWRGKCRLRVRTAGGEL